MKIKEKFRSKYSRWEFLAFVIFVTGSLIIYSQLGRWVAIGVALEYLSLYILIKAGMGSSSHETEVNEDEENDILPEN